MNNEFKQELPDLEERLEYYYNKYIKNGNIKSYPKVDKIETNKFYLFGSTKTTIHYSVYITENFKGITYAGISCKKWPKEADTWSGIFLEIVE